MKNVDVSENWHTHIYSLASFYFTASCTTRAASIKPKMAVICAMVPLPLSSGSHHLFSLLGFLRESRRRRSFACAA